MFLETRLWVSSMLIPREEVAKQAQLEGEISILSKGEAHSEGIPPVK